MKIIKLSSTNIKRLVAVEIKPDGNVVRITGKNGSGKTSVLDSIMFALAGKDSLQSKPVRAGEKKSVIRVDLGDYIVERTFTEKDSYLKVLSRDGARYPSPQKMLDDVVGRLSFDPLEFVRMKPLAQADTLRELAGIDTTEVDRDERSLVDERKVSNRIHKELEGALKATAPIDDAYSAQIDTTRLTEKLDAARAARNKIDAATSELERADNDTRQARARVRELQAELRHAEEVATGHADALKRASDYLQTLGEPVDERDILEEIQAANGHNLLHRDYLEYQRLVGRVEQAKDAAKKLDDMVEAVRERRKALLDEARFPLEGLSVVNDAVTFNDVPLDQASLAEQIRVSTAVAMSLNPTLRVLRITDGSLLDTESMAEIEKLASDNDYQVWIEVVDETGKVGFFIEDGQLEAINGEPTNNPSKAQTQETQQEV